MENHCEADDEEPEDKPACECEHEKGDYVQVNFHCKECDGYLGLYQLRK